VSNSVSEKLKLDSPKIMQLWEQKVRLEVSASVQQDSLVLQDSLPLYLNQLVEELSTHIYKSNAQLAASAIENSRIGKKHGQERAGYADYTLNQVIFEYHLLRQAIFEVLESEAPLDVQERDIIINSIEQAVNDAASQFSQTLQDIQDMFMVTLTHDLRNPLHVIKMGTQAMLRRMEQDDSNQDIAKRVLSSVDRLNTMIQNLLDASRIRAGYHLKLNLVEENLDTLVHEVVKDLSVAYGERFVVICETSLIGNCDAKELRRVIENLVINAVKYGAPTSPITLILEQTKAQIILTIHNEGDPIKLDSQSILFQQFRRTISSEDQTGWGLGLFLAKNIIEAHHGTIRVESEPEKGTNFIIKLPKATC
jgi:signal transduction histidine kinase